MPEAMKLSRAQWAMSMGNRRQNEVATFGQYVTFELKGENNECNDCSI